MDVVRAASRGPPTCTRKKKRFMWVWCGVANLVLRPKDHLVCRLALSLVRFPRWLPLCHRLRRKVTGGVVGRGSLRTHTRSRRRVAA